MTHGRTRPALPACATFALLAAGASLASPPPVDRPPQIRALTERAAAGDPAAQVALGMRYRDGIGVRRDPAEALRWYRRSADQGDAAGLDNVGFMFLTGRGVPANPTIAAAYFKASADGGHPQGMFNLGNCYFSGQGVEQDYARAIDAWERASRHGHANSRWRLAMLLAPGEGTPRNLDRARQLCEANAAHGHADSMLLLGELLARNAEIESARSWWQRAAEAGSAQATALLELDRWRRQTAVPGNLALVELDHLYQGWNNCGATSLAMFLRQRGTDTTPYAIKRMCPHSPIGTGTDWAHLVAAGEALGQPLELATFAHDDEGFAAGVALIRSELDAGRPVVIDFTVEREGAGGSVERFGHTLVVSGYHAARDQFVLRNPNQPSPGVELISSAELEASWVSRGYSRSARGQAARPLIIARNPR